MDVHPTPFPGNKSQLVKSKYKKVAEAPKQQKAKEPSFRRQRRTFGTIRNTNVPITKTVPEKQKSKPSNLISDKQPKPAQTKAESEIDIAPVPVPESAKKSPEAENRDKPKKKKSVSFPDKPFGSGIKKSPAREDDEAQTPVRPPFSTKPVRVPSSGTPYVSAEKCSNCRFDRLETAAYWLGQIKSAESVGKHFVSAAFFRLAIDCKAEPMRNLKTELKRYLARNDGLSNEMEWKEVSRKYGVLKDNKNESYEDVIDSSYRKATPSNNKSGDIAGDQEQKTEDRDDPVKEIYEQET